MNISLEAMDAHKSYPGYDFVLSTARVRPITGREWVYTATPEQVETLIAIERLFECLINSHYDYSMRERHTDDFDGWTLTIGDKHTRKIHTRRIPGFPVSAGVVLREIHAATAEIRRAQEED